MGINSTYILGKRGRWLLTEWCSDDPSGALLVIFPPFAEEANRCRRVFANLAQELSKSGWRIWLPDWFGTGDSDGDFDQIDLDVWIDDLETYLSQTKYTELAFLACRFGALVTSRYLDKYQSPLHQPQTVILWQPLTTAEKFWKQLFRTLQVSSMIHQNADKHGGLQALLRDGFLDAQGYTIPLHFYQQTILLSLNTLQKVDTRFCWLECSQQAAPSAPLLDYWQKILATTSDVEKQTSAHLLKVLPIEFFWLTQNPVNHQSLLEETILFLNQR